MGLQLHQPLDGSVSVLVETELPLCDCHGPKGRGVRAVGPQRALCEPQSAIVLMRGQMSCCGKRIVEIAMWIKRRQLPSPLRAPHCLLPFALECMHGAFEQPSERIVWVGQK